MPPFSLPVGCAPRRDTFITLSGPNSNPTEPPNDQPQRRCAIDKEKGRKAVPSYMRAERLFRSPQLFRRNRPKIPCTWPDNPTHAASFLRQFSPQHSPVSRLFRGKKGLFAPPAPASPPFCPPERPRFAPAPPVFARCAPGWRPGLPRFYPGPRRLRTPLEPRKPPRVRLFARPRPLPPAVRRPNARRSPHPPLCAASRAPPASPLPPPPPRHSLGADNPDCRGQFSCFAVEKCATPRGDQIHGHDG